MYNKHLHHVITNHTTLLHVLYTKTEEPHMKISQLFPLKASQKVQYYIYN